MKKLITPLALGYLRFFAKLQLAKFRPIVIGVGGASGKTSLSGFIALILEEKHRVLETKGKNSSTGIPLSILRIKLEEYTLFYWIKVAYLAFLRIFFDWRRFNVLVAEMGIDGPVEPKNMSYLLKIIRPKLGTLTNISFEHSVYFEKNARDKSEVLEKTKEQEAMLLKSLPRNGAAVLNLDDGEIRKIEGIKAQKITVSSIDKTADFFIEKTDVSAENFKVSFINKNKKYELEITSPLPTHYASSFLLAIALCTRFGFAINESIRILENKFSLPSGRLSLFKGIKKTTIIDSSYNNATLAPIMDILELLKKIAGKRRRVAVIGDMRELGKISMEYHEKVAEKILETTDLAILIGPLMMKYAAPVLQKNNHNYYSFETFSDAKETILNSLKEEDLVLVKGSQNTLFLERVVEMLLMDPKDKNFLPRRGKFWDKRRKETL